MPGKLEPTPFRWLLYLRGEEVFGHACTLEELGKRLAKYPRQETTRVLSGFGLSFDPDHPEAWHGFEKAFLRQTFLRPATRKAVELLEAAREVPVVAFCRQQVLLALRLIQTFASGLEVSQLAAEELQDLGDDLLRVSDLLPDFSGDELSQDQAATVLLPVYDLSNSPTTIFSIKRTYDMVVDSLWATDPVLREAASVFHDALGLSIRDFFHCLMLPLSHFYNQKPPAISPILDFESILTHGRDRVAIRHVLDRISIPIVDLPKRVPPPAESITDLSQEPFRSAPLVRIDDTKYIATDLTLLKERLRGVFWTVKEFLPLEAQGPFLSARGRLFERYVHSRLKPTLGDRYVESPTDSNGDEITDGIVDYGTQIVMLEFKDAVLREETKFSQDAARLREAVLDKFLGSDQLSRALERLLGPGSIAKGVISSERPSSIFPVLVCHDQSLCVIERFVGNCLRERLLERRPPGHSHIQPLTIISADDIENLLYFLSRGNRLSNLLRERFRRDPNVQTTFHNFLYSLAPGRELRSSAPREEFVRAFEESKRFWEAQGSPELIKLK